MPFPLPLDGDHQISLTLTTKIGKSTKRGIKFLTKQHERFSTYLRRMVDEFICGDIWRVYEFTQRGFLHVHAMASIGNRFDLVTTVKVLNVHAELAGFFMRDISVIKNKENWITYMRKDIPNTEMIKNEIGLPLSVYHHYKTTRLYSPPSDTPEINTIELEYGLKE